MAVTTQADSGGVAQGTRPLEVLGLGASLVAYVYAVGGGFEFVRFARASLPATQALALLSSRQILIPGVVFALIAGVLAVGIPFLHAQFALWWKKRRRPMIAARGVLAPDASAKAHRGKAPKRSKAPSKRGRPALAALLAAGSALVLGASISALAFFLIAGVAGIAGLAVLGAGDLFEALLAVLGIGGVVAASLPQLAADSFSAAVDRLLALSRPRIAAIMLALVAIAGLSFAFFVPLRLPSATVALTDQTCVYGLYLARNSDGVHLVDGQKRRIITIAPGSVAGMHLGGFVTVADKTKNATGPASCVKPLTLTDTAASSGNAAAQVYLARVMAVRSQIISALAKQWRIQPGLSIAEFDVPTRDGIMLSTAAINQHTVRDLGRLHGQLEITYSGWRPNFQRRLTRADRRRLCRTIAFVNVVEIDMKPLPNALLQHFTPTFPPSCPESRHRL